MTTATSSENLFAGLKTAAAADTAAITPITQQAAEDFGAGEIVVETISELDTLKARAKKLGLTFSNNISVDTLRAKITAKLNGEAEAPDAEPVVNQTAQSTVAAQPAPVPLTAQQIKNAERTAMIKEQMRLVRCRITNLNPAKKDLPGEIFTFANRVLGAVKKFVPYGEVTENGYHIPFCIYTQLKERQFVNIKVRKDSRGREIVESSMAREFAIEVLDPLTPQELAALKAAQAAANSID